MKKTLLTSVVVGASALSAQAGSDYKIENRSAMPIVVIMDSNREKRTIAAAGNTTFVKANVGDRPTFRVYWDKNQDGKPDNPKQEIAARKAGYWEALRASAHFNFTGSKLESD